MNLTEVGTLIGSYGFPVVSFLLLFWYVNTTMKDIQKALENNTLALTQLQSKLDKGE